MEGKICTFFGHRDCPESVRGALQALLEELIQKGVTVFYVGNEGNFDALVQSVLRDLSARCPQICCLVVLAYLPKRETGGGLGTLLPEGIETVPKRFAISWRNRWMLRRADCAVVYVTHPSGGAAQFAGEARRQGKPVCNLGGFEGF